MQNPWVGFLEAALIRVWESPRRPYAVEELALADRKSWSLAPGRSLEDSIWIQAAHAEGAVVLGETSAAICTDGRKLYESFELGVLERRVHQAGMNRIVTKMLSNSSRRTP